MSHIDGLSRHHPVTKTIISGDILGHSHWVVLSQDPMENKFISDLMYSNQGSARIKPVWSSTA
jgi:hypothetical protein